MKITRRKLAAALATPVLAAAMPSAAAAQTPAAPADPLEAAKARIKANGDALAKEDVPMSTEPAFQFKA
ncbi:MAG: hypothetical protein WBY44_22795 [Bryobacteraceae bacterium]|jgi:hypothetical protein